MIQSSTSPCFTTISGTPEEGSNALGVSPSTVMKKVVGLLGSFGSRNFSEKYSLRVRAGVTLPNQGSAVGGSGSGAATSVERGSGASDAGVIVASMRFGSFSPPTPGSTVRVTSNPGTPELGPFTRNSTRAPGGTPI